MGLNYYAVLGITRSACDYDIKMAFRRKAVHYNPERNNSEDCEPMFTLICEAYEVLSDKFRKAIYDQYGEQGLKSGVDTPLGHVPPYHYDGDTKRTFRNFFGTDSPYADLLNAYRPPKEHSGGNRIDEECKNLFDEYKYKQDTCEKMPCQHESRSNEEFNANLQVNIVLISLEEIYTGCLKLVSVPVKEIDPCSDELTIIDTSRTVHVQIKPGLPENTAFRFSPGPNEHKTTATDVLVVTKDKPHEVFWREGPDLHMKKTATLKQALTGFSFTVTTLDGRILHIPITDLTTCHQSVKVIKSEGMPLVETPHRRGDLVINLSIEYPKTLSPELRKTLETLLDDDKGGKNTTRTILDGKLKSKAGALDLN